MKLTLQPALYSFDTAVSLLKHRTKVHFLNSLFTFFAEPAHLSLSVQPGQTFQLVTRAQFPPRGEALSPPLSPQARQHRPGLS